MRVLLRGTPILLLLAAGAVVAVATTGTTGDAIAMVLVGLACILLVSFAFYEVGLSEDRDRARGAPPDSRRRGP